MKINFSKKVPKDTFYTLVSLNWLLRSTGLSNIYRKQTQLAKCGSVTKSLMYVFICGLINCACLYFKLQSFKGNTQTGIFKFSDSVQLIYWISYLEYIIDIYYVHNYCRGFLVKYLKTFDKIDTVLGRPPFDKIRTTIIQSTILSIVLCFINSFLDYTFWVQLDGWISATIYSVDYLYFFLNMLTVLDAVSHIIQVEYRLGMIGNLMQVYRTTDFIKSIVDDTISHITSSDNKSRPLKSLKILCHNRYLEANWFNRCYLQLLEQVAYINLCYGFRILMYCLNLLVNMINLLNMAIRVADGSMEYNPIGNSLAYLPSISSTTRALNYALMSVILMYRCEQAYKQYDRILEIVDVLLNTKNNNSEMKNNLIDFRTLLITRPIKFHAAKFFVMDYTLLVSMSSVVVGYTIIILQSMQ